MGTSSKHYSDEVLAAVARLSPIAEDAGLDMATMALAWVLRRQKVASAITGASRPEQVRANAEASGVGLHVQTLARIGAALGEVPVRQPTLATGVFDGVLHR